MTVKKYISIIFLFFCIYANGQSTSPIRMLLAQQTATGDYPYYQQSVGTCYSNGGDVTHYYNTLSILENDIIILFFTTNSSTLPSVPTGYTSGQTSSSANLSAGWYWMRAAGNEEGSVILSGFASVVTRVVMMIIRGCAATGDPYSGATIIQSYTSQSTTIASKILETGYSYTSSFSFIANGDDADCDYVDALSDGGSNTLTKHITSGVCSNASFELATSIQSINTDYGNSEVDVSYNITNPNYYISFSVNFISPLSSPGIQLGWESAQYTNTEGDGIVNTEGTLIEAKNVGASTSNETVNGVTFTAASTWGGLTATYAYSGTYADGGVGADFDSMLDRFAYKSGASANVHYDCPMTGLTVGKTYLVQVFYSDDRSCCRTRTQKYQIQSYVSETLTQGTKHSIICRFEATATTENLEVFTSMSSIGIIVNGYQVRQLD